MAGISGEVGEMIGTLVGDYRIEEEIGDGGHAFIFKCRSLSSGEVAVAKMLKPSLAGEDDLGKRFEREAEILAALSHPNVLRFLDYVVTNGHRFLIQEYMDRGTFDDHVAKHGPMDPDTAATVFDQGLRGVEHCHTRGYIHRDLKPANFLVNSKGDVKLYDFGVARVVGGEALTSKGYVIGTTLYMAPEMISQGIVSVRTDIYSLGVTLFELLTGRKPFEFESQDESLVSFARRVCRGTPAAPSLYASISDELEAIVLKAISQNPQDRFKNVAQLRRHLARVWDSSFLERSVILPGARPADAVVCEMCGLEFEGPSCPRCITRLDPLEDIPRADRTLRDRTPAPAPVTAAGTGVAAPPPRPEATPGPREAQWEAIGTRDAFTPSRAPHTVGAAGDAAGTIVPFLFADPSFRTDPEALIGHDVSGRYSVIRHLASGGFAHVYLVTDSEKYLDDVFVLRVPAAEVEDPDRLAEDLKSQYKIWRVMSRESPDLVVRLFDVERIQLSEGATVGLVMEFMEGGSLEDLVRKEWGGQPKSYARMQQLMRLFLQVCRCVEMLHDLRHVHRDIKPSNMLLTGDARQCKITDFELFCPMDDASDKMPVGTPGFMAPECQSGEFSTASDIFALGMTLHYLLTGLHPGRRDRAELEEPLQRLNPFAHPEHEQIIRRCVEWEPAHRYPSVSDLIRDLSHLGVGADDSNAAPLNLANLLLRYLSDEDLAFLGESLTSRGFSTQREDEGQRLRDLVEEYCYTCDPREILEHNFTGRQIDGISRGLGLQGEGERPSRDAAIGEVLETIGFLRGARPIPGIDATVALLKKQQLELPHATTRDERLGIIQSALAMTERAVDLLVAFYSQMIYGSAAESFIAKASQGQVVERLSFGHKARALRALTVTEPGVPMSARVLHAFRWPILDKELLHDLDRIVEERNRIAHPRDAADDDEADLEATGRRILGLTVDFVSTIADNPSTPRVVQIRSREDDVYGRHFYVGVDDRGHIERIFTPLPIDVGRLYLFFPLTNPVRINPLIFRYDPSSYRVDGS